MLGGGKTTNIGEYIHKLKKKIILLMFWLKEGGQRSIYNALKIILNLETKN